MLAQRRRRSRRSSRAEKRKKFAIKIAAAAAAVVYKYQIQRFFSRMNSGVGEKDFSQGSQPSSSGTSSKPSKRRMFAHSTMALETYVTTYKRLTKGNGNNNNNIVQSSLDPELFSLCGLLSVCELIIAGLSNDLPVVSCLLLITVVHSCFCGTVANTLRRKGH